MKYKALMDVPPMIKKGDIVEFKEPLVDSYKHRFEKAGDEDEITLHNGTEEKTAIIAPDLEELKSHLAEEGVEWRDDMTVVELFSIMKDVSEKKAKSEAETETDDDDLDNGGNGGGAPDRNELKARATELGITFASNIPTDKLVELIKEAEEKANA